MGRLLITNSEKWENLLHGIYERAGFPESAHVECGDTRVTVYKRLKVDNCNYFEKNRSVHLDGCINVSDFGKNCERKL